MIWPRWAARFGAWLLGYFWLPCPVCKEPFAGFEAHLGTGVNYELDNGGVKSECVCSKPGCVEAANRESDLFYRRAEDDSV